MSSKYLHYSFILVSALIFVGAIYFGVHRGLTTAQARLIVKNADTLRAGLDYFLADQGRYPTASEFNRGQVLQPYFSKFPPKEFISELCDQTYVYERSRADGYSLSMCLPAQTGPYQPGWNPVLP